MQRERPTEEKLTAAVKKAENLARTTEECPEHTACWGNNFYMLFTEMRQRAKNPDVAFEATYLNRAETLGQPWQDFLSNNQQLLKELDSAFDEWDILQDITQLVIELAFSGTKQEEVKVFERRFDEQLGFKAISVPIYQKLNPLLEKAAAALRKVGIDPFKLELIDTAK